MKKDKWLAFAMVIILATVFFTVSCSKKTIQTEPSRVPAAEAENPDVTPADVKPMGEGTSAESPEMISVSDEVDKPAFMDETIYFEFDSALLSSQAREILIGQADYLRGNVNVRLTLEGHCDERGTEAYNMALGQRRADAVKKFLSDMGIPTDRLTTISWGEERPAVMGHNESAWGKNRRTQFVIN